MTAAAGPQPPLALYIHVPFCFSVCPYCDFVVYAGRVARDGDRLETFVGALVVEIGLRATAARRSFGTWPPLGSVYIGGGTPSLLGAAQVARILAATEAGYGIAAGAEITLESNPGLREHGDLAGFRAAGVNRLSIGAQSMDDGELRLLGRRHTAADVAATVQQARRAGFANVSLDLLYDVPGQSVGGWHATLAATLALEPEHVSAYALTLDDPDAEGLTGSTGDHLPLRAGARLWRERAQARQDQDVAAACYEVADEAFARAGLAWYELSNWSRPGRHSRHNLAYWRWLPCDAVGPGAHAFDGERRRRWNAARLDGYLAALLPADPSRAGMPPGGSDVVDRQTATAERAILALRTHAGLSPALAGEPAFARALAWGRSAGLLEPTVEGGVRLSTRGRMLASELSWRLLPDAAHEAA